MPNVTTSRAAAPASGVAPNAPADAVLSPWTLVGRVLAADGVPRRSDPLGGMSGERVRLVVWFRHGGAVGQLEMGGEAIPIGPAGAAEIVRAWGRLPALGTGMMRPDFIEMDLARPPAWLFAGLEAHASADALRHAIGAIERAVLTKALGRFADMPPEECLRALAAFGCTAAWDPLCSRDRPALLLETARPERVSDLPEMDRALRSLGLWLKGVECLMISWPGIAPESAHHRLELARAIARRRRGMSGRLVDALRRGLRRCRSRVCAEGKD